MKSAITECALLLMAVAVCAEPTFARSYLHCLTKKVVIVDAAKGKYFVEYRRESGLLEVTLPISVLFDGPSGYLAARISSDHSLGRHTVNTEPLPGSLSTVMSPPIIWQNRLLIASPSPVPPYFRVVDASA
jgi:hypothetical protein